MSHHEFQDDITSRTLVVMVAAVCCAPVLHSPGREVSTSLRLIPTLIVGLITDGRELPWAE
ncbi:MULTISPECIES: hypothetical protein [unclassified Synechococcus]|uniref:hypothetical protein n=1 Tax=unclassified Synechococcus TaxID=2626047 RepID=UPI0012E8B26C|nr:MULTISPECIES: hypothetical protein [unclassified Synechococcus]